MLLKHIHLFNFRNYVNKKFEFKPGLNGIIGANGSGKSSIIEAICFALTGDLLDEKSKVIRSGETTGYVICDLEINGKACRIERHLDSSKCLLKYGDEPPRKKAADVKELWDSLFKIDSHIFNNVVVAKQKEIPLLFSGDNSVRERIFQKIFNVPNVEKIRTTIYNNYIKTAPPEIPEFNLNELNTQVESLQKDIDLLQTRLSNLVEWEPDQALVQRAFTLRSGIANLPIVANLNTKKTQISEELCKIDRQIETINDSFDSSNLNEHAIQQIRSYISSVESNKKIIAKRNEAIKRIAEFELHLNEATAHEHEATQYVTTVEPELEVLKTKLDVLHNSYETIRKTIQTFSNLDGKPCCPTCQQPLQKIQEFLDIQKKSFNTQFASYQTFKKEFDDKQTKIKQFKHILEQTSLIRRKIDAEKSLLDSLPAVEYDEQKEMMYRQVIAKYEAKKAELINLEKQKNHLLIECEKIQGQITSYCVVDDSEEAMRELRELEQKIEREKEKLREKQELQQELTKFQTMLDIVSKQKEQTLIAQDKNEKRKKYLDSLQAAYDVLHPSRFPRRLIKSYVSVVQDYLDHTLQNFNIPYDIKITESFRLAIVDAYGNELPRVSGGQEMVVGLALRLALHQLFAQSFPFAIFDEASQNMDENNKQILFDVFSKLKQSSIKQILVIDHNTGFENIVDHCIQL